MWRCSVFRSGGAGLRNCVWHSGSAKSSRGAHPRLLGERIGGRGSGIEAKKASQLRVGPWDLRVSAGIEVEFNDNINVSQVKKESDLIIRPTVGLNAAWKLSAGKHAQARSRNRLRLLFEPSGIQYKFTAGQPQFSPSVKHLHRRRSLNFHDRFSVQQDPVQQSSVSNTSNFGSFENTIGVQADWKLSSMIYTVGYDHYNYISRLRRVRLPESQAPRLSPLGPRSWHYPDDQFGLEGTAYLRPRSNVAL